MMSVLVDKNTRILIQGITGKQGQKLTREMLGYGTSVVCGVTPGKKGKEIEGVPVYDSVEQALKKHKEVNTSLICVPRNQAKQAAIESITTKKIHLLNILTEGIPNKDAAEILQYATDYNARVVGPASIGIVCPADRVKLGAIGGNDPGVFYPGSIALFSKSGGMCLSLAMELFNKLGYGVRIVVGIGGDRIVGTTFKDLLELVRDDPQTKLVLINGEVGGNYEEEAASYIKETLFPKRVVVRLTGVGAESIFPRGSRMGHAGAIIGEGEIGTYESKIKAFEEAGVPIAKNSEELITLVEREMPPRAPDFEKAVFEEVELVSISKSKLEGLKEQVRAIQIRTSLTQIIDGIPYFRGYALPELIERASILEMLFMALVKEEPSSRQISHLQERLNSSFLHFPPSLTVLKAAHHSFKNGNPLNVACSDGLLALPEPEGLKEPALVNEGIILITQVISIIASILGNDICPEKREMIETKIFRALAGRVPGSREADIIRAFFVACVDHTPATPSSLSALTSYSGGNSLKTALSAGITAMGDTHAGAGEGAAKTFYEFITRYKRKVITENRSIGTIKELAGYIVDKYTGKFGGEKRRIPGYGHRYYSDYGEDPRAKTLLRIAKRNNLGTGYIKLAEEIEIILKERKSPGLCLNVDGAIGALLCEMGLKSKAGKATFIIPRTVGILGQLLEQKPGSFFRLSNESIVYTGPEPKRKYKKVS